MTRDGLWMRPSQYAIVGIVIPMALLVVSNRVQCQRAAPSILKGDFVLSYRAEVNDPRSAATRAAEAEAIQARLGPAVHLGLLPASELQRKQHALATAGTRRAQVVTLASRSGSLVLRVVQSIPEPSETDYLIADGTTYRYESLGATPRKPGGPPARRGTLFVDAGICICEPVPLPGTGIDQIPLFLEAHHGGPALAPLWGTGASVRGLTFAPCTVTFAAASGAPRPAVCTLADSRGRVSEVWHYASYGPLHPGWIARRMTFDTPFQQVSYCLMSASRSQAPDTWLRPAAWLQRGDLVQVDTAGAPVVFPYDPGAGSLLRQISTQLRRRTSADEAARTKTLNGNLFALIFTCVTAAVVYVRVHLSRRRAPAGSAHQAGD